MANDKKKPSIASQGAVMRRVLRYIGPHVSLVVLSLALCLISVALTLYVPILVGRAVDCIVGPNAVDFAALKPILLTIAVCIVVTAAAQWLMNALHNRITVYLFQKYLESHSITLMADDQKLTCICID